LGNFITLDRTITLNAAITIGNITASDTDKNYTISGANILTLDRTSGVPTIDVTTSGRTLTISSQIAGTTGLQKNGAGTLTLSGANTYSGGTVLSAGTIAFGANNDTYLGATSGGLTFNGGQIAYSDDFVLNRNVTVNANLALNNRITVNGVLSGSSSISQSGADTATFANTGNTFTGPITIAYAMTFASLGDSSNPINMSGNGFTWTGGAKTFALRPFTLSASAPLSSSGTGALVIQQPLAFSGAAGARTLTLSGSYAGINTFAGDITNSVSPSSVVSLTKGSGNSIWALSGINTYTGATTLSYGDDNGILIFQGMQALSPSTSLNQNQPGSNTRAGTIKFLDDSATPASRSTVNLNFSNTEGVATSDLRYWMRVFVGNNSTANGGTSSSTQTGSTIQLGNLNLTEGAVASTGGGLQLNGANGYKLQIANLSITLQATTAVNHNATLLANAPLTVTGNVQQANDAAAGSTMTLQLDGTATGNLISGNILNSAGGRLMNVTKAGTGTWTLSGVNTYTGTTTVSGGKLLISSAGSLASGSAVTVSGGSLGGNGGSLGGAVTVSSTGGIDLRDGTIGNLTLGSTLNITGAAGANYLRFDMGNGTVTSDQLIVAGATTVTTTGAAVIDLNWLGGTSGRTTGTYTLIGGAGTLDATNFGKFSLLSTKAFGQTYTLVHDASTENGNLQVTVANVTASANNVTLQNSNPLWTSTANFNPAYLPDYESNVTIASAIGTTGALNASQDINSLNYTTAATTGTTITPGTAAAGTASNMLTIEAAEVNGNTAGNGITLQNTSGTHTISANIGLAASQTWTIAGSTGGLTVSGVISDFGFARSLTKAGFGTLRLSGANTYSGGTVLNAGTLWVDNADVNLGAAGSGITINATCGLSFGNRINGGQTFDLGTRPISLNNGAVLGLYFNEANKTITVSGPVTGDGGIIWSKCPVLTFGGGTGALALNLLSTNNSFTGPITVRANSSGTSSTFTFNSLADSTNPITIGTNGDNFNYGAGAVAPLTLNSRQIVLAGTAGTVLGNNSAQAFTINTDLATSGTAGNRFLALGSGTGTSKFNGKIADGTGRPVYLSKAGSGTWYISNTNTYSGTTTITGSGGSGTLVFQGRQALPSTSTVYLHAQYETTDPKIKILDDGAGTVTCGNNVYIRTGKDDSGFQNQATITVGNNNTANGGTSSETTTGSTIVLGNLGINVPAGGTTYNTKFAVNILGSNGYRLQFANVDLPINGTSGNSIFLRPTTAPVTITSTVKQVNGNTAGKAFPLELAGTATNNLISGAIKDPDDYPANTNARALSIIKSDTGTWTLSGINTFSGTTTVSAGTLVINGGSKSQCLPDNNLLTINAGKVHLPAGVNEKVGSLKLGAGATITGPTTYGSTASGAAVKNDTYFDVAGTGILYVGMDIPNPGTMISFF